MLVECTEIIASTLEVADILPGAVLEIRKTERLLVRQISDVDQETELGIVVSAELAH